MIFLIFIIHICISDITKSYDEIYINSFLFIKIITNYANKVINSNNYKNNVKKIILFEK